jgi:plasmid stabilization system protein ParE
MKWSSVLGSMKKTPEPRLRARSSGKEWTKSVDKVRFARWVPDDLVEALDWYDSKSIALGNRFRNAVDAAFSAVEESPEAYPFAFPDLRIRFYRLRRFPYLILYRVEDNSIVVLGVRHGASDPEKWRRRAE